MRSGAVKTIRNYRTEMLTLFGLTVLSDGAVEANARNSILIESQSFPLFFRNVLRSFSVSKLHQQAARDVETNAGRGKIQACKIHS